MLILNQDFAQELDQETFQALVEPYLQSLFAADVELDEPLQPIERVSLKGPLEFQRVAGRELLDQGFTLDVDASRVFFVGRKVEDVFRPLGTIELIGDPKTPHFGNLQRGSQEQGVDRFGLLLDRVLRRETERNPDTDFTLRIIEVVDAFITLAVAETVEGAGDGEPRVYELRLERPSQLPDAVARVFLEDLRGRVDWLMQRREEDGQGRE